MSRSAKIVIKCIQHSTVRSGRVSDIRLRSENAPGDFVRLDITFADTGESFDFQELFGHVGIFSEDLILAEGSTSRLPLASVIGSLDKLLSQHRCISFFLSREHFRLTSFLRAVQSQTVFGMPEVFRNRDLHTPRFFVGAAQEPQILWSARNSAMAVGIDGLTVVIESVPGGMIEFSYLNPLGELHNRSVGASGYFLEETKERIYRYKFQNTQGYRVFLKSTDSIMNQEQPLHDSAEFRRHVSDIAERALGEFLREQVTQIESRINAIPTRKKLFFLGQELGLEPINELETVILFERYLNRNSNKLGGSAYFRLLEYSPQGIDSICEFAPDPTTPKTAVGAEFEFHLKNFFLHGHDPNQVALILCYTKRGMEFPYVYFGVTYDIDRSGPIPRLVSNIPGKSAYLFILDEILECR